MFEPGYVPVPPSADQPFHERTRNAIARHGISGRKFAELANVPQPVLSRFFKGYGVRPETASKIEQALAKLQENPRS